MAPSAGRGAAASWNEPRCPGREGGAHGASKTELLLAALRSLGASIFHASGAVFVFLQMARAARWARAVALIHHQAAPSSPPRGCRGLAAWPRCGPSSPSLGTAATALSWTQGQRKLEARLLPWGLGGGEAHRWKDLMAGGEAAVTSVPGSAASSLTTRSLGGGQHGAPVPVCSEKPGSPRKSGAERPQAPSGRPGLLSSGPS